MDPLFGKRLARARAEKQLTQRELADAIGITFSQISRYEASKARPRLAILMKLAEALGTTPEFLAGDSVDDFNREVTLTLKPSDAKAIDDYAESHGLSFSDAANKVFAMGLKMKYEKNPDMLAQLEAELPGAYEKLLKLLAKE